jgi:GxxExxY protein
MTDILYKTESYKLVGILFEVHNNLGKGFSEIVYKDALEYEFKHSLIQFEREKEYSVNYKDTILKHKFYADFVVLDKIILEIKSCKSLNDEHIAQCINYLKVSNNKLAILVNFNEDSLEYKRIIL